MAVDPLYENLNAPQLCDPDIFIDDNNSFDDSYFDYDHEAEGGPKKWRFSEDLSIESPDSTYSTPVTRSKSCSGTPARAPASAPQQKYSKDESESVEPEAATSATNTDASCDEPKTSKVPANICTNLEEWRSKTSKTQGTRSSPRIRQHLKKSTTHGLDQNKTTKSHGPLKPQRTLSSASQSSEKARNKVVRSRSLLTKPSPQTDAAQQPGANSSSTTRGRHVRSLSRDNSGTSKSTLKRTSSMDRGLKSSGGAAKADLHKDKGSTENLKTSEERELARIQALRAEAARRRHLASQSLKLVQKSTGPLPVHSTVPPTKPEEFKMATSSRLKNDAHGGNEPSAANFASMLRKAKNRSPKAKTGATVVKPFHFAERKRKIDEPSHEKYKSDAECLREFSTKTPTRFHTKPKDKGPSPSKKTRSELTKPRTPLLETRSRTRAVAIESQEEKEAKELEEAQLHQFKAKPVNEKVLHKPGLGIKKVPRKEPTKPEPFHFESDHLPNHKANNSSGSEEPAYHFRARPLNTAILQGPKGIKPSTQLPLTHPQSPAFALKNRLQDHRRSNTLETTESEPKAVKAHQVPHYGLPFVPNLEHKVTQPKPFSFDSRQQEVLQRKEEKLREIQEEEKKKREFHAQPLPDSSPDQLPQVPKRPPTKLEPFSLDSEIRGSSKASEWSQKQEELLRQQRKAALFKAKPAAVLQKDPFKPAASAKPLTDVTEVTLNTEKRSEQRMVWETEIQEEKAQQAAILHAQQQLEQEEQEEELRKLRLTTVTRANPVRHYKPVEIKPSDKPLTQCETPRFSERLRSRTKQS